VLRSPPSSIKISGLYDRTLFWHQSYSDFVWPDHAKISIPFDARKAAMSSWVVRGFPAHATILAPSSCAPINRTDVSFVI
jgi:hypothetical protein